MEDWSTQGLRYLQGVGPKLTQKLEKLGLTTQRDLLFHLPLRYEDRTSVTAIGALQPGQRSLVQAEVLYVNTTLRRQRSSGRVLVAKLADHSGVFTIRLFYFSAHLQHMLEKGNWIRCFGEVRIAMGELEMVHPELKLIDIDQPPALDQNLTPVYSTTEGLHQQSIKKIVAQVIDKLQSHDMAETLPQAWLAKHQFPNFKAAMLCLHRPRDSNDAALIASRNHPAQHRFAIEELTAHKLALLERRAAIRARQNPQINTAGKLVDQLLGNLPFTLTQAQQTALQDLLEDFDSGKPMQRLLQGDVGSGKTIVAALACLPVVESGFQAALMVPTEILAEQHYQNFRIWLESTGINVVCLLGADKGKKRERKLAAIASAEASIIIGTHALFQASVEFNALGFIVIDEQHRFGVDQRMALQKKTVNEEMPHQLIMTATPIPRTLAMSTYADLDYTQIDELPPGRKPVTTSIVSEQQRKGLIERVAASCQHGGQVYWVCTLIEESEALQCEAAEVTFQSLQQQLPQLSIALVHGRMKAAEKESVIQAFKSAETQILVATTVIEVGVDVPNASIMIIENPERLGLSQIHQLRGRVGRGSRESFCILLVKNNLSESSKNRMNIIRKHQDGFIIAEQDLQIRGAGEVLGTRQTGAASFKIADLLQDQKWFAEVDTLAGIMRSSSHQSMRQQLLRNWVGVRQIYTEVG
ncbi:MAG: ATP-dependent DNA helicase RecG [Gammaproteobacteria bacterium]|nr:ATP-dependent DNA helicase RecG [Gammaproteobacteria bacterium]